MISKFYQVWAIVKKIDKEDIIALRDFVSVCKENGLSIVALVKEIIFAAEELKDELQD